MSALLEVHDLEVAYGGRHPVVRGVDLQLAAGERLGVIGESGCGKSTLGLALMGLLADGAAITGGSVRYDGRELVGMPERALCQVRGREIALVYQDASTSLDFLQTVGTQLAEAFAGGAQRVSRRARRGAAVTAALEEVAVPGDRALSYPHQLSGGMRQRVSIAMALAQRPRLVVADEPTTALDVTTQAQVLAILDALVGDHGTALMLITHDLGVVADHCDTTAVMYAGKIVESGPTGEVLTAPRHPYTRALVDAARGLDDPAATRLPTIPGAPPLDAHDGPACAFAPRCPARGGDARCHDAVPVLRRVAGRAVACHHAEEVGA